VRPNGLKDLPQPAQVGRDERSMPGARGRAGMLSDISDSAVKPKKTKNIDATYLSFSDSNRSQRFAPELEHSFPNNEPTLRQSDELLE
jgi:hypothetical protein